MIQRLQISYVYLALAILTALSSLWLIFNQGFGNDLLITGLTIDLNIIVPLFAFLFFRSRKISPTATVPVFVALLVVSSILLPTQNQGTLQFIIHHILPIIELTVVGFIGYKIYQARKYFSTLDGGDFSRKLDEVLLQMTGKPLVAKLIGMELNMFYFLLFKWKKSNGFSYHQKSGVLAMLFMLAFAVIAETTIIHLVLVTHYPITAWILFCLSVYSFLPIISLAKSVILRRIFTDQETLYLHYGWLHQCEIELENIEQVNGFRSENPKETHAFIGFMKEMEGEGVEIITKDEVTVRSLFGKKTTSNKLFIPIDDPAGFSDYLKEKIS